MTYGYIRVSTDRQTVENQRFEIKKWCRLNNFTIDGWIEESISGTQNYTKRKLGKLLENIRQDDTIICTELSRLGRNFFMIMEILNICIAKDCNIKTIKENFILKNDIQSKILAFAFSLSAEIERQLISQRTKEALAARKAAGKKLGRAAGKRGGLNKKCVAQSEKIDFLIKDGIPKCRIAKLIGISTGTLYRYLAYTDRFVPKKRRSKKWSNGIYQ